MIRWDWAEPVIGSSWQFFKDRQTHACLLFDLMMVGATSWLPGRTPSAGAEPVKLSAMDGESSK